MEENEQEVKEQENQPDPVKEKASTQGWVEKEQFKGDPARWVDADEFVKRGESILPVLKERNDHLVKEIGEMKKTFNEFAEYAKKGEERAFQRALNEIEGKKLQAVQEGDVTAYQTFQQEQAELAKTRPAPPQTKPVDGSEDPLFKAFKERNGWYENDPELTAEADALGVGYHSRGLPYAEALTKVEASIKKLYPEKFANSRRDGAAAVEFATDTGLPKKRAEKAYDNLPSEAKDACNKFIARGYIKSKEEYVANYDWGQ